MRERINQYFQMIRKLLILLLLHFSFIQLKAQVSITTNVGATALINDILDTTGTTLSVSNASLICDSVAHGLFIGPSNLGLDEGIILSTGTALNSIIPFPSKIGDSLYAPGDPDLTSIASYPTYDACILEFDFIPFGDTLIYKYVFTSEEYPSFNCTNFNDVFAFFISGPGYATPSNVALLPNSSIPVSINSVNNQFSPGCGDSTFYVNNVDTFIQTHGFTVPLMVKAPVTNGQQYHLKIGIADAFDEILNSYVFIGRKTLLCKSATPNSLGTGLSKNGIKVYPTIIDNNLTISDKNNLVASYEIISSIGKRMYAHEISSRTRNNISFENLSRGVYFIRLMDIHNISLGVSRVIKK